MTVQQLPEGWQMVTFGDIAKHISKRVEPSETELDIYVGLEHLDPHSLKIKNHGVPSDVTGQKLLVRKGQVIFGKRRAYQRKVAVADWDCICSAHAMVLEANPDKVIPDFLPFFMQSDAFMNRAVAISEGSLSPTIKWKALSSQSFAIPGKETQKSLVKVLSKADEILELKSKFVEFTERFFKRLLLRELWSAQKSEGWKKYKVSELGEIKLGRQRSPKYTTGKYSRPYLRVVNVLDGELDLNDVEEMDFNERDFLAHKLEVDDILVTEGDITSVFNVGRSAMYRGEIENCCVQNTLIRFRAGPHVLPEFAFYLFRCAFYKGVFSYISNMTTVAHLGADRFGKLILSVPSIEVQQGLIEKLRTVDLLIRKLRTSLEKYDRPLRRSLSENLGRAE